LSILTSSTFCYFSSSGSLSLSFFSDASYLIIRWRETLIRVVFPL
jgi:hypothetical protein